MSGLTRGSVKPDNNCLFTSFARLCEGIEGEIQLKNVARHLRSTCAESVKGDQDPATRALMLGHDSLADYAAWIQNDHHWGGESEVLMLAEYFKVNVVITSCESLSALRYDIDGAFARIYLLYTGQHYDPLLGSDGACKFALSEPCDAREAAALDIAREHNAETARRASEKRVTRLKCAGCGALCDDAAAFQAHCSEVEHDDDFTYECTSVEVVLQADEAMPDGAIDLTDTKRVHVFYNAASADALSLSMRCAAAPFEVDGAAYATMEDYYRSPPVGDATTEQRRALLAAAVRAQLGSAAAAASGLRDHLLETGDRTVVCVDIDPWLGMQAAGGISTGQNGLGKILMELRQEIKHGTGGDHS